MLYRFHVILIVAGILFSLGMALYQLLKYGVGEGNHRVAAAGFAACGMALSIYLRWFLASRRR